MSLIYFETNGLIAVPVSKIDGVRHDFPVNIIQLHVGHMCHTVVFETPEAALNFYKSVTQDMEDYYNKKEK